MKPDFNTTLVTVQLRVSSATISQPLIFQYNACYGSTTTCYFYMAACGISIQRLLRFNLVLFPVSVYLHQISIQRLLRFNFYTIPLRPDSIAFQYNACYGSTSLRIMAVATFSISIQRLLRFNFIMLPPLIRLAVISIQRLLRFNPDAPLIETLCINFNTTLVTVQRLQRKQKPQETHISIQRLLRFNTIRFRDIYYCSPYFNTTLVTVQQQVERNNRTKNKFQYNACYGSTRHFCQGNRLLTYFNTTLVTVQLNGTGYEHKGWLNFNTTLVTVQQCLETWNPKKQVISIQRLLRFNMLQITKNRRNNNFNTTLVTVQPPDSTGF